MSDELPPDWAIGEALKPFAQAHPHASWNAEMVKENFAEPRMASGFTAVVIALARYIAEHEQPPVDPAVATLEQILRHRDYMKPALYAREIIADLREAGVLK